MSAKRGRSPARSRRRGPTYQNATIRAADPWLFTWLSLGIVLFVLMAGAGLTTRGRIIDLSVQHFLLRYGGVFALITLTAAVGVGLIATDRIVMTPSRRVHAQALHRAVSFGAMSFLIIHIVFEIIAGRSHLADAVIPFLDSGRRFYLGLGTAASDLFVLVVVTGIMRSRFVAISRSWAWRALHSAVYLAWPLGIMHGLLAGRSAKPYVDWSYGASLALVGLVLVIRFVATSRDDRSIASQPVPERPAPPMWPQIPAAAPMTQVFGTQPVPIAPARPAQRALPAGTSQPAQAERYERTAQPDPYQRPGAYEQPVRYDRTVPYNRTAQSHPYDRAAESAPDGRPVPYDRGAPYDQAAPYGRAAPPGPYDPTAPPATYSSGPYNRADQPPYDRSEPLFADRQASAFDDGFGAEEPLPPAPFYRPERTS